MSPQRGTLSGKVRARAAEVASAVRAAALHENGWTTGRQVRAAWRAVTTRDPALEDEQRWTRAVNVACSTGVVMRDTTGRQPLYVTPDLQHLRIPRFPSELARVEEAIRRAVLDFGGAVPIEVVRATRTREPDIGPVTGDSPLYAHIEALVRCRRVVVVHGALHRAVGAGGSRREYFTMPGEPARVAPRAERKIDRRVRAILLYWERFGLPFSTRTVARFAARRNEFAILDDRAYSWTVAMQWLERTGFLTRVAGARDPWFVLWAPAEAWVRLGEEERKVREDRLCVVTTPSGDVTSDGRALADATAESSPRSGSAYEPSHDGEEEAKGTCFVISASRNRAMRRLVAVAQERHAAAAGDLDAQKILRRRPLTTSALAHALAEDPSLLARGHLENTTLHRALFEASRLRRDTKRVAIVFAGRIEHAATFTAGPEGPARTFVRWAAARASLQRVLSSRALDRLRDAIATDAPHAIALARCVVRARALQIAERCVAAAEHLRVTATAAERLPDEREDDEAVLSEAYEVARAARMIAESYDAGRADAAGQGASALAVRKGSNGGRATSGGAEWLIDVADAHRQMQELTQYRMATPRQVWTRIDHLVGVERVHVSTARARRGGADALTDRVSTNLPTHAVTTGRRGRPVTTFFDRPSFAAYVAMRWGGPDTAGLATLGVRALGELRDPEVVVNALGPAESKASHDTTVAALALLDCPTSRTALARYLHTSIDEPTATRPSAVIGAAFGLMKRPVGGAATELAASERCALVRLSSEHASEVVRAAACRVLTSWDEQWTRDQLLQP